MDLASVVAALASVGVRVSGSTSNSNTQVDSSRACPTGLASPEPSGTINDPGQHFQDLNQAVMKPDGGGLVVQATLNLGVTAQTVSQVASHELCSVELLERCVLGTLSE